MPRSVKRDSRAAPPPPKSMAALVRAAALRLAAAPQAILHLSRRPAGSWRTQALVVATLALTIALLFTFTVPSPLAGFLSAQSSSNAAASPSSATAPPASSSPPPPPIATVLHPNLFISTAVTSPPYLPPPPPPPVTSPPYLPPPPPSPIPSVSTAVTSPPYLSPPPPLPPPSRYSANPSGGDRRHPSPQSERRVPLTTRDWELIYAKREIANAPVVAGDPELYPPLFRNVSVFKRSYELMEKILKVYIYQDGPKPIFHKPDLKGIYASEGWFMKLMEESKKYTVKDPNKAHLFYLPYGSRELELALYVPDSHNLKPLSIYLKNYVNMISAKYPFWNRTRGADHFLVACHDWGPYTTKLHDELRENTIKALCNADVSEGVFIRGKDVSLPETSIRTPRRPLRDLGGKPVSQRSILAFFAGNMHGRVRPILLKYWSGKDEDMKIYGPLPNRIAKTMSYIQHMKSSKFCICPMGYEVNSPRIVEAIYYECVPVIIADNFVLPFEDVLDWSAFSVIVAQKDIPNLKDILQGISLKQYISMQSNVKRLQRHFLWHARPVKYDIFHMILHSIWFNRLNQIDV